MITPIVLCGGSGTRLWPLSRKSYPKQFSALLGDESLFQASARRLSGGGFAAPVVVTADAFRFLVAEQLGEAGIRPSALLIEPEGRDTAPAVLAATVLVARDDPGALLLVAPSDHLIPDPARFRAAVMAAVPEAEAGRIVTFGIRPDRAETGYGYLELADGDLADGDLADGELEVGAGGTEGGGALPLRRFVEKPDAARACAMLAGGRHLWNAGLFLFRADAMLAAARAHAPQVLAAVEGAVAGASADLGFLRLAPGPWGASPAISIDYAVMEKAEGLAVVPYDGGWSDLGDWASVWRETAGGGDGNALSGPVTPIDCEGTLLRSESPGQRLVGIGLRDMIAVAMPDAVLVAPRERAQEVREAVAALKRDGAEQAESFPRDHRPWGWFESLATGSRFQVKRIVVRPGASLSLQSHHHRSEHWIVVEGTAKVTVGDEVRLVTENQSVYIPLGARHRMENPGKLPMVLIEVQTGAYLGEDDIVRHEDAYARP